MFGNMMEKLQQMKQKVEESKKRLDTVFVDGIAPGGKVKVTMSGNRKVKSISIDDALLHGDKEELEDLIIIATNNALDQAEKVYEAEMQGAAMGLMPGMGL